MKIALAQINTIVGDCTGNARRAVEAARLARERGADLAVFPELTTTGYPPKDLLLMRWFVEANRRALDQIAAGAPPGMGLIVGCVEPNPAGEGRGLLNAAVLIEDGRVIARRAKTLLPTYDVFDEDRYFDPAAENTPVEWRGRRLGLTICEDAWNDRLYWSRRRYACDPVERLAAAGTDLIVNISASPFTLGKRRLRHDMFSRMAVRHRCPIIHVNLVGGNDDLIFDGSSAAFGPDGAMFASARDFEEDLVFADISGAPAGERHAQREEGMARLAAALELGTRDYLNKCGFRDAVVGLSGGIDSAVVATVATRALGPQHVTGVAMPSRFSSEASLADARALAENLAIRFLTIPIEPMFEAFLGALKPHFAGRPFDTAEENIQARVRGTILMALSNKFGWLVLSTGNKSEMGAGYCTLYGDMAGGLAVLADVPKTMVYDLARFYNQHGELIPASTLAKPPSAELRPDQKDSDSLPEYAVLDPILRAYVEEHLGAEEIAAAGHDPATVARVLALIHQNEYKRRQAPPALKVTSHAFGTGWRMPIAKKIS
ncbi:MAG: NAD+ synthase [Candidatus Sumerlaeia bacterium]